MQMFMNPCKLCDFMWGTTMHRGTRTTILAPRSGRNHYCFDLHQECKTNEHRGEWSLSYLGQMGICEKWAPGKMSAIIRASPGQRGIWGT